VAFKETVAEIDLSALTKNVHAVHKRVGSRKIIAIVKADAYGHGAVPIAQALIFASPNIAMLGVASLDEGVLLRKARIETPILLLTGCPIDRIAELVRYQITPALFDEETLLSLSRFGRKKGCPISVHIKIDTGMGRLGISSERALPFLQKAMDNGVLVEGLFSHFAEADLTDLSFARAQLAKLMAVARALRDMRGREELPEGERLKPYCHLANSAAIIHFRDAYLDGVRPGLMLYGYSPLQGRSAISLAPVMTVRARVIGIKKVPSGTPISYGRTFVTRKETRVAVVGIGYADGYPRALSNCGEMIAGGCLVPVMGRVCMDMTMLDVTAVPQLSVGDWVTVMGQASRVRIGADTLAKKANTIPYEILCGMRQIPKVYTP
jgi:alanine racemase